MLEFALQNKVSHLVIPLKRNSVLCMTIGPNSVSDTDTVTSGQVSDTDKVTSGQETSIRVIQ
jgi:hypothetical protein